MRLPLLLFVPLFLRQLVRPFLPAVLQRVVPLFARLLVLLFLPALSRQRWARALAFCGFLLLLGWYVTVAVGR